MSPEPTNEEKNLELMLHLSERKFSTQEGAISGIDTKIGIALGVIATFVLPLMADLPKDYPTLLQSLPSLIGLGIAFVLIIGSVASMIMAFWIKEFLDPPAFQFLDPDQYGNVKFASLKKGYIFQFRNAYDHNAPVLAGKAQKFTIGIILLFLGMLCLLATVSYQSYMAAHKDVTQDESISVTGGDDDGNGGPSNSSNEAEPAAGSGQDIEHMGPPYGDYLQKGSNPDDKIQR